MILYICIGLLLFGIFCMSIFLFDWISDEIRSVFAGIGAVISLFTLVFGFGLFCVLEPVKTTKSEINDFEVVHTSYSTIVDTKNGTRVLDEKRYSGKDKDELKVFYVHQYNSYGFELTTEEERNKPFIQVEIKE